jgi:hypothetical protein
MLPALVTHYFERDYGPFLNICDLPREEVSTLVSSERDAPTAFNRFALGAEFLEFRRAADDLLIDCCRNKFHKAPARRPFYVWDRSLRQKYYGTSPR